MPKPSALLIIAALMLAGCSPANQPLSTTETIVGVSSQGIEIARDGKRYKLCGVTITSPAKLAYVLGKDAAITVIDGDRVEVFIKTGPGDVEELLNGKALALKAGQRNNDRCINDF